MADLNLNQENDLLLPDPELPVIPEPEFPENEFVPNQVVVKFNPEISEDEIREFQEQLGAEVLETR
jgi:hypothetical protein